VLIKTNAYSRRVCKVVKMKKTISTVLLSLTLLAAESQHNFKAVNFYGNTIKNVQLIFEDDNHTATIWYHGVRLNGSFMIVNCKAPEKFCLVRSDK